jgi:2'-5' RNA ligase
VRLFIAIDLSQTLRKHLSQEIEKITRILGSDSVRWVKASNIHLTLKFLGETPEDKLDRIKYMLEEVTSQFSSFNMDIGEFGCFPNFRKPRIFWIGVHEHDGILKQLHRVLETDFEKLGFKKEGRPLTAHLTLGRLRKNISSFELQELSTKLEKIQIDHLGIEVVKEICLFSSVLRPSGAEYTRRGVFKFRETE